MAERAGAWTGGSAKVDSSVADVANPQGGTGVESHPVGLPQSPTVNEARCEVRLQLAYGAAARVGNPRIAVHINRNKVRRANPVPHIRKVGLVVQHGCACWVVHGDTGIVLVHDVSIPSGVECDACRSGESRRQRLRDIPGRVHNVDSAVLVIRSPEIPVRRDRNLLDHPEAMVRGGYSSLRRDLDHTINAVADPRIAAAVDSDTERPIRIRSVRLGKDTDRVLVEDRQCPVVRRRRHRVIERGGAGYQVVQFRHICRSGVLGDIEDRLGLVGCGRDVAVCFCHSNGVVEQTAARIQRIGKRTFGGVEFRRSERPVCIDASRQDIGQVIDLRRRHNRVRISRNGGQRLSILEAHQFAHIGHCIMNG